MNLRLEDRLKKIEARIHKLKAEPQTRKGTIEIRNLELRRDSIRAKIAGQSSPIWAPPRSPLSDEARTKAIRALDEMIVALDDYEPDKRDFQELKELCEVTRDALVGPKEEKLPAPDATSTSHPMGVPNPMGAPGAMTLRTGTGQPPRGPAGPAGPSVQKLSPVLAGGIIGAMVGAAIASAGSSPVSTSKTTPKTKTDKKDDAYQQLFDELTRKKGLGSLRTADVDNETTYKGDDEYDDEG